MDKKNGKKKTSVFISIIWAIITLIWISTTYMSISSDGTPGFLIALQCGAVAASGAAAIANFIRYRRGKTKTEFDEEEINS